MESFKGLYAFKDPLGGPDAKSGITGSFAVRLGVYQNSYSRNSHVACFDIVYVGPPKAIENLEKVIKQRYDWSIERDGRGHSEWISNITIADIEKQVDELIKGYQFKIHKVPKDYLPLTVDNLDSFMEYVKTL